MRIQLVDDEWDVLVFAQSKGCRCGGLAPDAESRASARDQELTAVHHARVFAVVKRDLRTLASEGSRYGGGLANLIDHLGPVRPWAAKLSCRRQSFRGDRDYENA